MKTRLEFLLVLLLFVTPHAYAQKFRNVEQDVTIDFSGKHDGFGDPGVIFGRIENKSSMAYPCVRLDFIVGTRFDHAHAGETNREASIFSFEVHNLPPHSVKRYWQRLPLPSSVGFEKKSECSWQPENEKVVVYEEPNFGGRSRSFGIGRHRLFNAADFNDSTSSMKVPDTLAVVVYEHADEGGGFGLWLDLLEDQPDLSRYNFNDKISFLDVFENQKPGGNGSAPFVYVRNSFVDGRFIAGHWEGMRMNGNGIEMNPLVGPAKPPNVVPPGFCTIAGVISADRSSYGTQVSLHRDNGSRSLVQTKRVFLGRYKFENVPEGRYLVIPKGRYPSGSGREGGVGPMPPTQKVICQPNGVHTANFKIRSWEG